MLLQGCPIMATPSARCFPRDDREFAREVESHLASDGAAPTPDALRTILGAKYPHIRIVERSTLATIDDRPVWYVYRDGRPVSGGDGVGAMRAWTRIEALTNRSLDLIEWSSDAMRRSEHALDAATRALGSAYRLEAAANRADQAGRSRRRISAS
jgi:hypothetical protein